MLKLVLTPDGGFDLAFDDPALADEDAALATLVYGVLFTDAQAPAARVPEQWERRGWWGKPQAGSPLWHVRRQPLSEAARREAIAAIQTALLSHAPALSSVTVSDASPAGSVSGVLVSIAGKHNGRQFLMEVPL